MPGTGSYWAGLGSTGLYCGYTGLYWVILGCNGAVLGAWGLCCPIKPGNCIIAVQFGEQRVPGTGLYWVILVYTGLYWVILGPYWF